MEEIGESVWRLRRGEGPSLLVIGGMHGNEATGIEVVARLRDVPLPIERGTLTVALGNIEAIKRGERFIDGKDLNRYFTDEHVEESSEGSTEEKRAQLLAALIRESEVVLDIHSTNRPSVPFISSKIDGVHERFYRWFGYENVLEDPNYVLAGERATVDEYADAMGNIGVCIETGQAGDTRGVSAVLTSIMGVLEELGIVSASRKPPTMSVNRYTLTTSIVLGEKGFRFNDTLQVHSFEAFSEGTVIGYEGEDEVVMPYDGVIVFPKLPEHMQLGKPVVYLAQRSSQ